MTFEAGLRPDKPIVDHRGSFAVSLPYGRYQLNTVFSEPKVLRGLHFQEHPYAQTKYVRVLRGTIIDVVLNIETGEWKSFQLTAETPWLWLYVPPGYAHGYTTRFGATVEYAVEGEYRPAFERIIHYNQCGINWEGLGVSYLPVASQKDAMGMSLEEYRKGLKR
jgi:dTDP-4-dehydrorhamnose 3,5-epimerase